MHIHNFSYNQRSALGTKNSAQHLMMDINGLSFELVSCSIIATRYM